MSITLEAYRAAIGSFHGGTKGMKTFFYHYCYSRKDYDLLNVGKSKWSKLNYKHVLKSKQLHSREVCRCIVGLSLLINILIVLAQDIELNPGPSANNISICHSNVRSLKAKGRLMHVETELAQDFDIITVSETWLSTLDNSHDYKLPQFQFPFQKDRSLNDGYGGLMVWVSNKISCKRRVDLEPATLEVLWLEIVCKNKKFYLCTIYRPPNNDKSFWEELQENIELVQQNYSGKIMIIGDLNADPKTPNGDYLENFSSINQLTQHILNPTRITENSATILDQCLSNFPTLIANVEILAPIDTCDHCVISITCKLNKPSTKSYSRIMWNFKETDFTNFRESIDSLDWNLLLDDPDINKVTLNWTESVITAAKLTVKNKKVTVRPQDKSWYNGYLRRLNRKKLKFFHMAKQNPTPYSWTKFKEARSLYQSELFRVKQEHENAKYTQLAEESLRNSKKWWKLLKSVHRNNDLSDEIPPIEYNGKIYCDDKDKANIFNNYFVSISSIESKDAETRLPDIPDIFLGNELEFIQITTGDVEDQLKTLDVNKAYGSDSIPPQLLKEGGNMICQTLKNLFNKSLECSVMPDLWKEANVTPIHKKDLKCDVTNYRPISILSVVGKVFERIVMKYVYNFLLENFILTAYQSGFQPGKSTVTQLLEVFHHFCKAVDSNKEMRVVFLDISKAFDKVWHKGLLFKLKKCGIKGALLSWFESYLTDRKQRVTINGQCSDWRIINAGVPQGSVLGPLLFLIYINDIVQNASHCNIRLFADDTCLFIEVNNRLEAAEFINDDLSKIYKWSKQWLINFAPTKTKALIISNKKDLILNPPLFLNGTQITEVKSHTYLGVTFTRNLRWNEHINTVYIKSKKRLNMLIPLKFKLDRFTLERLYNSYVLPTMDYAIQVWGGTYDSDINKLENIHVDGMRLVTGATARSNISKLYLKTSWPLFREHRDYQILNILYKVIIWVSY